MPLEAIRLARELNPKIRIFARAAYLGEISALRQAGADAVFSGEGEVASVMTEFILRQLGATPEQVDRERDRIRMELFGGPLSIEPSMSSSMQTDADSSCIKPVNRARMKSQSSSSRLPSWIGDGCRDRSAHGRVADSPGNKQFVPLI
jgi:hypothetical protein